jgi:hypothetical protein
VRFRNPYRDYIVDLVKEGIMAGQEDGTFGVEDPVSRREAMELLLTVTGGKTEPLAESAVDNRLVYTVDENTLLQAVTRLETAQMAARALDLLPFGGESPYSDCEDGYVVKLWEKGVWDAGSEFYPDDTMTRGELAKLLWNMERVDVSVGAFRYNGYWVELLEGVPLNSYDRSAFGWDGTELAYTGTDADVMHGVDVSRYQGEIDWEQVRDSGIEFAIVRVGGRFMNSSGFYEDRLYRENIEGANAAGVAVGAYFFSQAISAEEGLEEAEYVLSLIEGYDLSMPVVMDWEPSGGAEGRTYGVGIPEITAAVRAFCDRIRAAGHEQIGLDDHAHAGGDFAKDMQRLHMEGHGLLQQRRVVRVDDFCGNGGHFITSCFAL